MGKKTASHEELIAVAVSFSFVFFVIGVFWGHFFRIGTPDGALPRSMLQWMAVLLAQAVWFIAVSIPVLALVFLWLASRKFVGWLARRVGTAAGEGVDAEMISAGPGSRGVMIMQQFRFHPKAGAVALRKPDVSPQELVSRTGMERQAEQTPPL
ncbi:MAG: hypothetical protein HYY08_00110 [Firmicutes bacterium]|nr:hypothetical protein [Bacillota bacterium]